MSDDGAVPGGTALGGADRTGKYLTFSLAREIYGIPIARTKEIIGMLPLVSIPNTAPQVKGVINLRGRVIPVIDLRLRLGLREAGSGRTDLYRRGRGQGGPRDQADGSSGRFGYRGPHHQGA